ncbi:MAG: aminoacyl-tRNA hydrolase [Verrucomicrobiales bacterium]
MDSLFLIAGLGNPGAKYSQTRHNAGFMAVDRLAVRLKAAWKEESKFQSLVARAEFAGHKVILCKPQTYMNSSGEAVAQLARFYKAPLARLIVSVDDADLPFGQIRMRPQGSSGGHHGLDSVQQHIGSTEYARQKIGIGRAQQDVREITNYVLGKFGPEEQETLEKVLERSVNQLQCCMTGGLEKAMSQFNGAVEASSKKGK